MALLSLKAVTKRYLMGRTVVTALDGVTMDVSAGEFVVVTGRSGSGKSTLLNLLGGLDRPTGGEVSHGGARLDELGDNQLADYRLASVGFVFQFFNLMPTMTAQRNVELPLVIAGRPPAGRAARARELLSTVGLEARCGHLPSELSGGEQQRVAIARALAQDPPILLADEPTGNLDSKTAAEILDLLGRLHREQGKTVVLVTHDPATAGERAGRVVELHDGRVVRDERR